MLYHAPLQTTLEIHLLSGPALGQRFYRLSHAISLPPSLHFNRDLPVIGKATAKIKFALPQEKHIEAMAEIHYDPEHPEQGGSVTLINTTPEVIASIQRYIENRQAMRE